ncbi:MAG: hypothetical protein HZB51_26510 [Chloroflexi bacterium]|nr:hypothetical protein [Chloroflexota bacterium]
MKQLAGGCVGAIMGLIVGIVLTFAAMTFMTRQNVPAVTATTPTPGRSDVSITANATFINSQIQQTIRQSGLLKQASVTLASPNIIQINAAVDTTILGQRITANPTAIMRVAVKNNRIALSVEKIDTGNAAVPTSLMSGTTETLRAQAEDVINRQIQRALQGTSMKIVNVRMTPNEMTLDLVSQ